MYSAAMRQRLMVPARIGVISTPVLICMTLAKVSSHSGWSSLRSALSGTRVSRICDMPRCFGPWTVRSPPTSETSGAGEAETGLRTSSRSGVTPEVSSRREATPEGGLGGSFPDELPSPLIRFRSSCPTPPRSRSSRAARKSLARHPTPRQKLWRSQGRE